MKLLAFSLILVCCIWTFSEAGEIYEWIDENGQKHFSDDPPPKGEKIVKEIEAIPSDKTTDQKSVQEGTGAVNKDLQQQETSTTQITPAESSGSDDSIEGENVDRVARPREKKREHDKHKKEKEIKHK